MSPEQVGILVIALVLALVLLVYLSTPSKPKPLTVLVCGAAGVGKSTLINALIGAPIAQTGIGLPVTQNTTRIEAPSGQFAFYDSKGLEVEDASQTYLLLMSDLLFLRFNSVRRNQLDIVLMCIQEPQGRIDDAHGEIAGLCEDLRIPFAIALTKTEGDNRLEIVARQTFPRAEFVQRVRALELKVAGTVIPREGLDSLVTNLRVAASKRADESGRRARNGQDMSRLAWTARNLATTARNDDSQWICFAEEAWRLLGMRGPKWADFLRPLRKNVQKHLVPGFFQRTLNTRFNNQKIDGAIVRRLLPCMMRRFGDETRVLINADIQQACQEAMVTLDKDRPYRSRF